MTIDTRACILIAAGNPLSRQAGARLLAEAGYLVVEARTGAETISLAAIHRPDLILVDASLDDDLSLCHRLKLDPDLAGTYVVLLTPAQAQDGPAGGPDADATMTWPAPGDELRAQVRLLLRLRQAEHAQQKLVYDLGERVKELDCLYAISDLMSAPGYTLPQVLQGIADLLPPAFQHPELTCARITLDGQEFRSARWRETPWRLSVAVQTRGRPAGEIDVFCLEAPAGYLFLDEEARLIEVIAERLGRAVERMTVAQALVESEERFRTAFDNASVGICLVDMHGCIRQVNRRMVEMFGYSREELENMTVNDIAHPDYVDVSPAFIGRAAAGDVDAGTFEKKYIHKDGHIVWGEVTSSLVRGPDGEPLYFVSHVQDITQRKQAEEALRRRSAELQERNEELDAFAHTVAHDLKNLSGLVIGYAEALLDIRGTLPDEDEERALMALASSGHKMDGVIDALLLLAGARHGDVPLGPLDTACLVAQAQRRLAHLIDEHRADIVVPDASTWPVALGFAPWVEEVWVNYMSNAVKYGGCPPRVELGADAEPGGTVRFWVRDNGAGLTAEEQARLFAPFTQLAQVSVEGYGLGLSIVRRIVERLGGQVGVHSVGIAGLGSVFSFTLPAVSASTPG